MHYTPTYSSWLNQVENWFARIQRDVITRGVFTSTKDLDKKLMRYIRQYNKQAAPLKWKYADSKAPHPVRFIRFNGLVKHRLSAGRLMARSTVWPQEVQNETRRRHLCATAPSRSGSR